MTSTVLIPATSIAQVDTEYSADSIEFCPNVGFEDVFVCGTYQLLKPEASDSSAAKDKPAASEEEQKSSEDDEDDDDDVDSLVEEKTPPAPRVGRLYLFNLDGETPVEKQRIETAAILDSKW